LLPGTYIISTATTFSFVSTFLVGAYEGLSGRSAKMKELEIGLRTPWVSKSVNTATLNRNLSP